MTLEYRSLSKIRKERPFRDPFHPAALLEHALHLHYNCDDEEDVKSARMIFRDLVRMTLGFEELARRTKINSKSLHRMLSKTGNPTSRNMATIICCLRKTLKLSITVEVRPEPEH
jgi:DNA-binding phage protein